MVKLATVYTYFLTLLNRLLVGCKKERENSLVLCVASSFDRMITCFSQAKCNLDDALTAFSRLSSSLRARFLTIGMATVSLALPASLLLLHAVQLLDQKFDRREIDSNFEAVLARDFLRMRTTNAGFSVRFHCPDSTCRTCRTTDEYRVPKSLIILTSS